MGLQRYGVAMAYARLRGKIWYIGYQDAADRQQEQASKARTKTEAKRLADDCERQAERQRLGLEALPTDSTLTLGELCAWWLEHRCPEASLEERRYSLKAQVTEAKLGQLPLRAVTAPTLENHFAGMAREGYKPATINKLRSTLHTVFNRARKAGKWTGPNPVADTETRKVPRTIRDTLTAEEAEKLIPHVKADWRGFFAAAIYLGLRKGECAGLRKSDVDLGLATITVRASYDSDRTKGGHADLLPIPPPLLPFVEAGLKTSGPYLFPMDGGQMRPEHSAPHSVLRHALARAGLVRGWEHLCRTCKAKGVDQTETHPDDAERRCPTDGHKLWPRAIPRELRFHDLRHSCATILLRAGVDAHRVQRILRHADVRTTTATYAHLAVEDLRDGLAKTFGGRAEPVERPLAVTGTGPARLEIVPEGPSKRPSKPALYKENTGCGRQGLNLRLPPCEDGTLPLSYARQTFGRGICQARRAL